MTPSCGLLRIDVLFLNICRFDHGLDCVLRRLFDRFRSPADRRTSEARTDFLRMTLDHDTGSMEGTILRGRFSGMRLEELAMADLLSLLRECRAEDEEGARLLEAYLDRLHPDWRDELAGERAGERLKSLIRLYAERLNPEAMAIELAIRQWARSDAAASAAVESVDAARLSNVAQLYRRLGWSAEEARTRAVLLYAFIFGQSLIFLGSSLRKRASMTAACAEILIDVPTFDAEDSTYT